MEAICLFYSHIYDIIDVFIHAIIINVSLTTLRAILKCKIINLKKIIAHQLYESSW